MRLNNLWKLYLAIVLGSLLIVSYIAYFQWKETYKNIQTQHEILSKIISTTLASTYLQYESMLDIVAKELLLHNLNNDKIQAKKIFSDILSLNKNIVAFGLLDTNGELVMGSDNIDLTKTKNLLDSNKTRESFRETLFSNQMVIGRTYYFKAVNKWIIPIRKAFRDEKGKLLGVITAGICVDRIMGNRLKESLINKSHAILIIRNNDLYRQLRIELENELSKEKIYNKKIPLNIMNDLLSSIEKKYDYSIDHIMGNELTVSSDFFLKTIQKHTFSARTYNRKYAILCSNRTKYIFQLKSLAFSL